MARAAVLQIPGVNCEYESARALEADGLTCHEGDDEVMRVFVPGEAGGPGDDQRRISGAARTAGAQIRHLRASLPTLEDVFARAVGER